MRNFQKALRAMMITMLSLTAFWGCSTKTIVKIKPIEIPEKYLQPCKYKAFNPTESAEYGARNGDFKEISIELTQYALELKQEIDRCDRNASDARRYQEKLKNVI